MRKAVLSQTKDGAEHYYTVRGDWITDKLHSDIRRWEHLYQAEDYKHSRFHDSAGISAVELDNLLFSDELANVILGDGIYKVHFPDGSIRYMSWISLHVDLKADDLETYQKVRFRWCFDESINDLRAELAQEGVSQERAKQIEAAIKRLGY